MRQQKLSELHPPLHPNGGTAEPASSERAAENQFVRDQMLAQSLLAARTISICVRSTSCGTRTRMAGRQNLLVPLTLLKIILSISACQHIFCLSSLLSIHTVCVRRADGRFAREHMLSRSLPAARLTGQPNLSILHAVLKVGLAESTCSHSLCPPLTLSFRAIPS